MKAGGIVAFVLAVVLVILLFVFLAILVTTKPRKKRARKCSADADCASGERCEDETCVKPEGGKCLSGAECGKNMKCVGGECRYTDFVRGKRVRFMGEGRQSASRRRRLNKRAVDLSHLDVRKQDVRGPTSASKPRVVAAPIPAAKPRSTHKPQSVYDEDMNCVLAADADIDVTDMAQLGNDRIFLMRKTGNMLFTSEKGRHVVKSAPAMEKIMSFNETLYGVSGGVMHKYKEATATWDEVTLPTRQILHWSSTEDGARMIVRDLDYEYALDETLAVVDEGPSKTVRFYGKTAAEFMDVEEATGRAVTCLGDSAGDRITSVAFDQSNGLFVVNKEKRARGIVSVHALDHKIFYVAAL